MDIIFLNSEILFNLGKNLKLDTIVNINLLKYHSQAKFVLTDETSQPFYQLKDKLHHNGYPIVAIDRIPYDIEAQKGHKIDLWIQNNPCNKFVIIDTDSKAKEIKKWYDNVVGVDPKEGFDKMKRKITLSFLGKPHKDRNEK